MPVDAFTSGPRGEPTITLGLGVRRPQGRRVALDARDPVADLARVIEQHQGLEAWWSPSTYYDDYRDGEHWLSSWVLAADVDYHDGDGDHAPLPPAVRARVQALFPAMPATLAHLTPRGLRVGALLDRALVEVETHARAARTFASDIATVLDELLADRGGLRIDPATYDRARLLYTPRATVGGVERGGEIVRVGGIVSLEGLLARPTCVPSSTPVPFAERTHQARTTGGRDTSDSGLDASEALRLVRRWATDLELEAVLRERSSYRKRLARGERIAEDYLRRTITWARAQPVLVFDPWAGALRATVVVAKYRYSSPINGQPDLHRVRFRLATDDGEVLPDFQYVVLPIGGQHEAARAIFEATIGDLAAPEAWLDVSERGRLEAALQGRRLEVVLPAGGRGRASNMRRAQP